jgi:hypothetical protein
MIAILKLLVTFGPGVIDLISDIVKHIKAMGAGKDRKAAERAIFVKMWKLQNGITGAPPVPPRPHE